MSLQAVSYSLANPAKLRSLLYRDVYPRHEQLQMHLLQESVNSIAAPNLQLKQASA